MGLIHTLLGSCPKGNDSSPGYTSLHDDSYDTLRSETINQVRNMWEQSYNLDPFEMRVPKHWQLHGSSELSAMRYEAPLTHVCPLCFTHAFTLLIHADLVFLGAYNINKKFFFLTTMIIATTFQPPVSVLLYQTTQLFFSFFHSLWKHINTIQKCTIPAGYASLFSGYISIRYSVTLASTLQPRGVTETNRH